MNIFIKQTILFLIVFSCLCVLIFAKKTEAAACPLSTDTKIFVHSSDGLCYSDTDPINNPGFNTQGGTYSCGPVLCPGDHTSPYPQGNDCIVQINGQCFAGKGPSGFDTPGCKPSSNTPLPACPNPMNLTVQTVDNNGKGIANVSLSIVYADAPPGSASGQITTANTDTTGTAIVKGVLYSGDHFVITPSSPYYTFTPPRIGGNDNLGDQEMNAQFSCGTALENGMSRPPCKFIATRNTVPLPSPVINNQILPDSTIEDTIQSTTQTLLVIGAIGLVGYIVIEIAGKGRIKK